MVGLQVVHGHHGLAVFKILESVDDDTLSGLGSEIGHLLGGFLVTHRNLLGACRGLTQVILGNTLLCKSTEA